MPKRPNNPDSNSEYALVQQSLEYLKTGIAEFKSEFKEEIKDIKNTVDKNLVTKNEFAPVQKIVYGLVSLILVAVITAIIGLVIIK